MLISPNLLIYSFSPYLATPFSNHKLFSTSVNLFLNKFICIIFLDSTYKQYHDICLWLHLTELSLGPSILLQMTLIFFFLNEVKPFGETILWKWHYAASEYPVKGFLMLIILLLAVLTLITWLKWNLIVFFIVCFCVSFGNERKQRFVKVFVMLQMRNCFWVTGQRRWSSGSVCGKRHSMGSHPSVSRPITLSLSNLLITFMV